MRPYKLLLLLPLFMLAFSTPARAAYTYYDDFSSIGDMWEKSYNNLTYRTLMANHSITFAGFADNSEPVQGHFASATYRMEGVKFIRLGIYTSYGTFVHNDPVYGWTFGVGSHARNPSMLLDTPRAILGTGMDGRRGIYALINGQFHKAFWDSSNMYFRFLPSEDFPYQLKDSIDYGVNVYADGKLVPLTRTKAAYYGDCLKCYEEFSAPIPTGTASITVQINDTGYYPYYPSGETVNDRLRTGGLAFVELAGEELTPIELVPRDEEIAEPPESSNKSTRTPSSTSASSSRVESTGSSAVAKSASASEQSKQETQQPKSSSTPRSSATTSSISPVSSQPSRIESESVQESQELNSQAESAIHTADNSNNEWVYIIMAAIAIMIVLLVILYRNKI